MNPVWIIDDDRSIRWVFEKALTREQIPFKSFSTAAEALTALDTGGFAALVELLTVYHLDSVGGYYPMKESEG